MENTTLSKNTVSCGLSLAIVAVSNAVLVAVKEKSSAVMDGMKKVTGHHWITHMIIVIALFVLFAWYFSRANQGRGPKMTAAGLIRTLVGGVAIACAMIIGFYLIAD
jgi:uncharacterized membrane protein